MRKFMIGLLLFALAFILFTLFGCENPTVVGKATSGKPIWSETSAGMLSRTEFDGHVYIVRNQGYRGGICHDPDCEIKDFMELIEKR